MMTGEELSAIVARHKSVVAIDDDGTLLCENDDDDADAARQVHADRGALLDLLRRVAQVPHEGRGRNLEPDWVCTFCRCDADVDPVPHTADCPAPLLEALR